MKSSALFALTALAVALPGHATAESSVTISGFFKVSYEYVKLGDYSGTGHNSEDRVVDDFSRIYFRVVEDLGAGLQAIGQVTYMGNPVLNEDGTITAGIGDAGGVRCPCPVFDGVELDQAISKTYCYCCAGHFRYHYQIALSIKLKTREVVSSGLESRGKKPCRFVFEVLE